MFITTTVINDVSDLNYIINAPLNIPLAITVDKRFNNNEIRKNMWILSLDLAVIDKISIQDFINFVSKFLAKKRQEITQKDITSPVVFYMWFDAMAAQLRFNIISNVDRKISLPFGCTVEVVDSPEPIIEDFLTSHYHDGIPWGELEEVDDDSDEDEQPFVLKVYVAHIN